MEHMIRSARAAAIALCASIVLAAAAHAGPPAGKKGLPGLSKPSAASRQPSPPAPNVKLNLSQDDAEFFRLFPDLYTAEVLGEEFLKIESQQPLEEAAPELSDEELLNRKVSKKPLAVLPSLATLAGLEESLAIQANIKQIEAQRVALDSGFDKKSPSEDDARPPRPKTGS